MKALHGLGARVIAVSRTNTDLVSLSKEVRHTTSTPPPHPQRQGQSLLPHTFMSLLGPPPLVTSQCFSTVPWDRDRVCGPG